MCILNNFQFFGVEIGILFLAKLVEFALPKKKQSFPISLSKSSIMVMPSPMSFAWHKN